MTTIAYKNGVVCTDSRATTSDGQIWDSNSRKIFCVRGDVISCAGDIDSEQRFLAWYKKGCKEDERPTLTEDFVALVFTHVGKIYTYFSGCMPHERCNMKMIAEGSGAQYALGAMAAGCSPQKAVKIAMKFDTSSGGRIQTKRIKINK